MTEDEVTRFIIARLGELVVVLFNDHVGGHAEAVKARRDARLALAGLGNWAAKNGRADLRSMLEALAGKILDVEERYEPQPQFYDVAKMVSKIKYSW